MDALRKEVGEVAPIVDEGAFITKLELLRQKAP